MFLLLLLFTDFLQPINNEVVIYDVKTGDRFLDSGGEGQYLNCTAPLENREMCTSTAMLCGDGTISITFTEFALFPSSGVLGGDHLSIYSGDRLLYSSRSGISAKGMTFTDTAGCLIFVFTATSAYAMQGWEADIVVTGGEVFESPPDDKECNLVCKSNVFVSVNEIVSMSVLDFIMNPGTCLEEYTLTFYYPDFTNKYVPARVLDSTHKGLKFEYKVMTTYKGISNYCWGYINVR